MSWEDVARDDARARRDEPIISIARDRIHFNACFARMAQLSSQHKAKISVDPDTFRIGFRFVTDDDSQAFPLRGMNPSQPAIGGVWCTGRGVGSKYPWIRHIAMLHSKKDRQFSPKKDGDRWTIQLPPSCERRSDRNGTGIPPEARGIYRYLDTKGEVVYVGQGHLVRRLNAPERKDWDIQTVEYSIIDDQQDREYWEAYWLKRFKSDHGGRLPYYNRRTETLNEGDIDNEA